MEKSKVLTDYLSRTISMIWNAPDRRGRDPVESFCSTENRLLRHFASALVLMLRSEGVPARLATGFLMLEYDEAQGQYLGARRQCPCRAEDILGLIYAGVPFDPTPNIHLMEQPTVAARLIPRKNRRSLSKNNLNFWWVEIGLAGISLCSICYTLFTK